MVNAAGLPAVLALIKRVSGNDQHVNYAVTFFSKSKTPKLQ